MTDYEPSTPVMGSMRGVGGVGDYHHSPRTKSPMHTKSNKKIDEHNDKDDIIEQAKLHSLCISPATNPVVLKRRTPAGEGLVGSGHGLIIGPGALQQMKKPVMIGQYITHTDSAKNLMRQVSGLGMDDPVFRTSKDEGNPEHPSCSIFDDMTLNDVPDDMKDLVSIVTDRTARTPTNCMIDVQWYEQALNKPYVTPDPEIERLGKNGEESTKVIGPQQASAHLGSMKNLMSSKVINSFPCHKVASPPGKTTEAISGARKHVSNNPLKSSSAHNHSNDDYNHVTPRQCNKQYVRHRSTATLMRPKTEKNVASQEAVETIQNQHQDQQEEQLKFMEDMGNSLQQSIDLEQVFGPDRYRAVQASSSTQNDPHTQTSITKINATDSNNTDTNVTDAGSNSLMFEKTRFNSRSVSHSQLEVIRTQSGNKFDHHNSCQIDMILGGGNCSPAIPNPYSNTADSNSRCTDEIQNRSNVPFQKKQQKIPLTASPHPLSSQSMRAMPANPVAINSSGSISNNNSYSNTKDHLAMYRASASTGPTTATGEGLSRNVPTSPLDTPKQVSGGAGVGTTKKKKDNNRRRALPTMANIFPEWEEVQSQEQPTPMPQPSSTLFATSSPSISSPTKATSRSCRSEHGDIATTREDTFQHLLQQSEEDKKTTGIVSTTRSLSISPIKKSKKPVVSSKTAKQQQQQQQLLPSIESNTSQTASLGTGSSFELSPQEERPEQAQQTKTKKMPLSLSASWSPKKQGNAGQNRIDNCSRVGPLGCTVPKSSSSSVCPDGDGSSVGMIGWALRRSNRTSSQVSVKAELTPAHL